MALSPIKVLRSVPAVPRPTTPERAEASECGQRRRGEGRQAGWKSVANRDRGVRAVTRDSEVGRATRSASQGGTIMV